MKQRKTSQRKAENQLDIDEDLAKQFPYLYEAGENRTPVCICPSRTYNNQTAHIFSIISGFTALQLFIMSGIFDSIPKEEGLNLNMLFGSMISLTACGLTLFCCSKPNTNFDTHEIKIPLARKMNRD